MNSDLLIQLSTKRIFVLTIFVHFYFYAKVSEYEQKR